MSEGWISLHRGWRDNPIFNGEFSRADAWVWLIENACWKPSRVRIKGETIELQRGELSFAIRFLADKWGWSKSRVDRFLTDLRSEGMIEARSKNGTTAGQGAGQGQSIITICNYAKYQDQKVDDRDNAQAKNGTTAGQQRDKEEQGNKLTSNKEPNGSSLSSSAEADLVFAKWNEVSESTGIPGIRSISTARRKACQARIREYGLEAVIMAIEHIPKSAFLRGDAGDWSGANMKFFLRPDTVNNILEGQYDDRHKLSGTPAGQTDKRDGVARALDRRLGLDVPAGAPGRHDLAASDSDRSLSPPRLTAVR